MLLYAWHMSSFVNFFPSATLLKHSSIDGNGYCCDAIAGFNVRLYDPQIRVLSPLNTGVPQGLASSTLLSIPSFNILYSSSTTCFFFAYGNGLTPNDFGCAPSLSTSFASAPLISPRPFWNIGLFFNSLIFLSFILPFSSSLTSCLFAVILSMGH